MVKGGVFRQAQAELVAVGNQDRAKAYHLFVELRQSRKQIRPLTEIPKNPGLLLPGPLIGRQGGGIPGPELAERRVHKPPAGGGPLPDEVEILRLKKHCVIHLRQCGVGFHGNLIHRDLSPMAPEEIRLYLEHPFPRLHPGRQPGGDFLKANDLPVRPGPGRPSPGEVDNCLQEIGFPLGVFPADDIAPGVELRGLLAVVPKAFQLQTVNPHIERPASPR